MRFDFIAVLFRVDRERLLRREILDSKLRKLFITVEKVVDLEKNIYLQGKKRQIHLHNQTKVLNNLLNYIYKETKITSIIFLRSVYIYENFWPCILKST